MQDVTLAVLELFLKVETEVLLRDPLLLMIVLLEVELLMIVLLEVQLLMIVLVMISTQYFHCLLALVGHCALDS